MNKTIGLLFVEGFNILSFNSISQMTWEKIIQNLILASMLYSQVT